MPIEIKELHLNLHLNNSQTDANRSDQDEETSAKNSLVKVAVKEVLRILKEKEQR